MPLLPPQIERYARHLMLREVGGPGQQKLLGAHVALIGAGGLGGPAALYLAAAGVGRLTLIDDDEVSLSNLQRQILFSTDEIGQAKTDTGAARLKALNPDVEIIEHRARLTADNAEALIGDAMFVLDGCDNFSTRFIVNDVCHRLGRVLISGAVGRWMGQVGVFASGVMKDRPAEERLPCYRCLTPELPESEESCAEIGVIGPLTGIIGARMALEAVKEITGAGQTMAGRLWIFDGLSGDGRTVRLPRDPKCPVCGD